MSQQIQAVRGMKDILPQETLLWQRVESRLREIFSAYGYSEIRLPLAEKAELFQRSIGEVTDIVEKEMYTFEDLNHERLSLRPEGTAGCVRAGVENGLLHNQYQRLWYAGPMFRHERPQKGRYRQFHQFGVEAFGMEGPDIDAELIILSARLWNALGLRELSLQINTLGTSECRIHYRQKLVEYFERHHTVLDDDSRRRLGSNPLRILDSKNPDMQEMISQAPSLLEHLDAASRVHFEGLKAYLDDAGIVYRVNPRLVRGLDYYTRTVFEWVTETLGAQGTVCAGGRYDGLVEQLGGRATAAAGFALGMERLVELAAQQQIAGRSLTPHVYFALLGDSAANRGMQLAELLRNQGLRVECNCGGGSLKSQMKRADRSGAAYALFLGESEVLAGLVSIKNLRADEAQAQLPVTEAVALIKQRLDID